MMRRVLSAAVAVSLTMLGLPVSTTVAAAAGPPDADVAGVTAGLTQYATFARGLAETGSFGTPLPYLTLVPGGTDGIDFTSLLNQTVLDRITSQAPVHFGDLAGIGGTFDVSNNRHVVSTVTTAAPASGSTIERLGIDLVVTRTAVSGLALVSPNPLVDVSSVGGVSVPLTLRQHLDFTYDTATGDFALTAAAGTPTLTIDATASIPAANLATIRPSVGILEVALTGSSFTESIHLRGLFTDPDSDGSLAFSKASSAGPVPGELATAANVGAIVATGYAPTPTSTIAGSVALAARPSTVAGLTIPPLAASVAVTDTDLADATPTVIVRTGFDATLDRFQNLDNRDLASGMQRITSLLEAISMQRLSGAQGDLDLPFMKGRISDVVRSSELLRTFLAANIDTEGKPSFASLQQLFEKLDATNVGGATLDVSNVAWDQASSKLAFTLVGTRLAAAGDQDVDAARGQPNDPASGAVRIGDVLRPTTGIAGANADAPATNATVRRSYVLRLTVVLDLQAPKTGTACQGPSASQLVDPVNVDNKACPFVVTDPKSQTNTVVTELPRRSDRILLRTGSDLLLADADIDSPIAAGAVAGLAGFVGVDVGGAGAKATLRTAGGQPHLVTLRLKPLGDLRLSDASDKLAGSAGALLDSTTAGVGGLSFTASVPGAPSFFGAGNGDVSASMADISAPGSISVTAPGVTARLKPLDFAGSADPAALRAKVLNALGGVSETLDQLGAVASGGTSEPTLTQAVQVLGQSFASYAAVPALGTAVSGLTTTPENSLQAMLARLAPSVSAAPPTFDVDTSVSPPRLVLHVGVAKSGSAGSRPLGLAYDAGAGIRHMIGTSTGGVLATSVQTTGAFDVVLPLDGTIGTGPDGVQVLPGSTLSIAPSVAVNGANLDVTSGVLPLKLNGASIDAHPSVILGGGTGAPVSLRDWAKGSAATTGGTNGTCGAVICANLPVTDLANTSQGTITAALTATQLFSTVTGAPNQLATTESTAKLPLGDFGAGLIPYFDDLVSGLDRASFGGKLPFIGHDLQQGADFLGQLRTRMTSALGGLASTGGYAHVSDVTGAVTTVVNSVATGPVPVTGVVVTARCGGSTCLPTADAATIDDLAIGFDVGQGDPDPAAGCATGCATASNRPFSIGIPGLRLSSATSPDVKFGWRLHLGFGFSKAKGFYIDTSAPDELKVGLAVKLDITDAAPMSAELGFLKLNVTQRDPAVPIKPVFAGAFSIDVHTPDNALTLDEIVNAPDIGDLVSVRLNAETFADWKIKTDASSPIGGLFADFHVKWKLDTDPNAAGALGPLDIGFGAIGLNLPSLFGGVLKPIFENVRKVAKPLKPVIDAIQAPLPGLSDMSHLVGGGDISTLNLAELYTTYGDPSWGPLLKLIKLISKVTSFAATGNVVLNGFDIDAQKAVDQLPSPDHVLEIVKGQLFESINQIEDKLADPDTGCPECLDTLKELSADFGPIPGVDPGEQGGFSFPIVDKPETIAGLLLGKDVDLATFSTGDALDVGFHIDAHFGPIIPFPPIFVTVDLAGSIKARLRAGFDTKGIRDSVTSGNPAKLLNGLYLGDFDEAGKDVDEISVLGNAYLGVAVDVVIASAGIEGGIDLTAYMNLHDIDTPAEPDQPHPGPPPGAGDGKVRFAEFGADASGNFDPACIFDTSGRVAASISVYVKVGFGPIFHKFSHQLGSATLVDLTHNCAAKADPVLGEVVGDTLYVNVGKLNGLRGSGWTNADIAADEESVTVRSLHEPAAGGAFRGFSIDLVQHQQEFLLADHPGLSRVVIDGRGSDVKLNASLLGDGAGVAQADPTNAKRFDRPAIVLGSSGPDVIKAQTTNVLQADGGRGNDEVLAGDGNDQLVGGPGADSITGGIGDDRLEGDGNLAVLTTRTVGGVAGTASTVGPTATPGERLASDADQDGDDTIDGGLGRDDIYGQGGSDTINGGEQNALATVDTDPALRDPGNHLVGGSGADFVRGGGGDDRIFGDEDVELGEDAAGATTGAADLIDTGDGTDRVWAGNGDDQVIGRSSKTAGTKDTVYGNGGKDDVRGGDGDDSLYGGPDDDTIRGGLGDDLVKGGAATDHLGGDNDLTPLTITFLRGTTRTLSSPGDGADQIYGGPGDDDAYGSGGGDVIFGDDGQADCTGPATSAPEWTPVAEPVAASDGTDTLNGGPGIDRINGEGGNDKVNGDAGSDLLCGARDADVVSGGADSDRIWGGSGADFLYGDDGADRAYGNDDADLVVGGSGNDHLEGNGAADSVYGEADDDRIIGGSSTAATADEGDTILSGQQGRDVIVGDNGTISDDSPAEVRVFDLSGAYDPTFGKGDLIAGGSEADRGFGGLGDDTMYGGSGDDHFEGNVGNDWILGEGDQDDLIGGSSPEAFAGDAAVAANVADGGETLISGGDERDVIAGDNAIITRPGGVDPVTGGAARAVTLLDRDRTGAALIAVSGGDYIEGNGERDRIFGEGGNDYAKGNESDDSIQGNQDADRLEGNDGEDDLIGGSSFASAPGVGDPDVGDQLAGGAGADVILGDNGVITRDPTNPGGPYDWDTVTNSWIAPAARRSIQLLDKAAASTLRSGPDVLSGGAGDDVSFGQDGDDRLFGGPADDYQEGNGGADILWGDQVAAPTGDPHESTALLLDGPVGAAGQDDQIGGSSLVRSTAASGAITGQRDAADEIHGDGNADVQLGDNGRILRRVAAGAYLTYLAQTGKPTIVRQGAFAAQPATVLPARFDVGAAASAGVWGNDQLFGDAGDDVQLAQDGDDVVYGGADDDDMYGELGVDRMFGETGEDAMLGDRGTIVDKRVTPPGKSFTSSGPPKFTFTPYAAHPLDRRVDMNDDGDGAPLEAPGLVQGGNDLMRGGPDHDAMHGETGDDLMNGDSGGDYLFGDDGVDVMWGGRGRECAIPTDAVCNADPGTADTYVDYLFGGHGKKTDPVTGGADILDYRPRPGVDPQAWFDMTNTNAADPVAAHQHHQGIDWIYGGWDRDVMQADVAANGPNLGDRLLDWTGNYSLMVHCPSSYGGYNDVRQFSPDMQSFLQQLAYYLGAGKTLADVSTKGSSGYNDLALVYNADVNANAGSAYPTTPGHFDNFSCAP